VSNQHPVELCSNLASTVCEGLSLPPPEPCGVSPLRRRVAVAESQAIRNPPDPQNTACWGWLTAYMSTG